MIHSDFHIHSEFSYDAKTPLEVIAQNAKEQGLRTIGITDHANFNDEKFLGDLRRSAAGVKLVQEKYPFVILGVELTPIEKPEFDYVARTGTREGYVAPIQSAPFDIELAQTKEELMSLGVRYAVGAAHWRVDVPGARTLAPDMREEIREWHRQQMYLAKDERVTILGHPWYNGHHLWYDDFSVIPRSMHLELGAALKENGKYVECNAPFFNVPTTSERFRRQYSEFLRELFEMGIPITYGSDAHLAYGDERRFAEHYLSLAGFKEGDFSELSPSALW